VRSTAAILVVALALWCIQPAAAQTLSVFGPLGAPVTYYYAPSVAYSPVITTPTVAYYGSTAVTAYYAPTTSYYTSYYAPASTSYYTPTYTSYYPPTYTSYYAPAYTTTSYYSPSVSYYAPVTTYYSPPVCCR
jgi:hypothetical protein